MMKNGTLIVAIACSFAGCVAPAFAQVEHKEEWHTAREVQVTAPPPERLDERIDVFAKRDSDAAVAKLARQLFTLLNPAYAPSTERQLALYRQAFERYQVNDFRGALEAYKAFTFDKIRNGSQGVAVEKADPAKRTFIEFYNTADELTRGIFRYQMFDQPWPKNIADQGTDAIIGYYRAGKHNDHMVDVIMQNGQPGKMNWTYMPPGLGGGTWHLPSDKDFIANSFTREMCFSPLLVAYLQKKDAKYLQQWAEYVDDYLLNFDRDLADAGILLRVDPSGAGGPTFRHIAYLVVNAPDADRDFPATTLARFLIASWTRDIPLIVRGARATAANRAMDMYGALLLQRYLYFPELKYAPTLIDERRRILESFAREYFQPDGTSVDYAPNYNKNYIISPDRDIATFKKMSNPPAWLTDNWVKELQESQFMMARYLIRYFAPNGTLPGYKDCVSDLRAQYFGKGSWLRAHLPQALEVPENKDVVAALTGEAGSEKPSFTSEAYPYGGYYFMREKWTPDALFLYFHDFRPAESGDWRHQKNVAVHAYGQSMLNPHKWESPLLVDGAGNIYQGYSDLYPKNYQAKNPGPMFGVYTQHSAWQEPLENRWHTSPSFDFTEGSLKIPYAAKRDDGSSAFIDDVQHSRQIYYLRQAAAWIVCDRVNSEKSHQYRLNWSFEPDLLNPPGWDPGYGKKTPPSPRENGYTKDQIVLDGATQSIRTQKPTRPNLSIFQAASVPLGFDPASITQGFDAWHGNGYLAGTDFKSDHPAIVASLLYPRHDMAEELREFKPVTMKDGAAFTAITATGTNIVFQSAINPSQLQAGNIHAVASSLTLCTKDSSVSGIALDCSQFAVAGKAQAPSSADFEFTVASDGNVTYSPIYRPLPRVTIEPATDKFIDKQEVTLQHPAKDVDIRYTLDGAEPTLSSPVYAGPLTITTTTRVRAKAFRKGVNSVPPTNDSTLAPVDQSAVFTKADALLPPVQVDGAKLLPGLGVQYFEDDWTLSVMKLPLLQPLAHGTANQWLDVGLLKNDSNSYAFVYKGFIKFPSSGVYTFHGPWELFDISQRCGYELQLFIDGQEWYPATQTHNFGNWSVALVQGLHEIKVVYVDVRRGAKEVTIPVTWQGEKPQLLVSGPGLPPGPVPNGWLLHETEK